MCNWVVIQPLKLVQSADDNKEVMMLFITFIKYCKTEGTFTHFISSLEDISGITVG